MLLVALPLPRDASRIGRCCLHAALVLGAWALAGCGNSAGSSTGGSGGGAGAGVVGDAGSGGTAQHSGGKGQGGSAVDGGTNAGGEDSDGTDLGGAGAEQAAGSGAGGSSSVEHMCQAGVMNGAPAPAIYDVLDITTGDNGTFTDECDAEGNLIEYICQYLPPTPKDPGRYTGQVVPVMVDCLGGCEGGTCYVSKDCPKGNDEVTWVSASASSVVIDNPRAQIRYTCTTRTSPYGFDCNDPALAGTMATVNSVGPCSTVTDLNNSGHCEQFIK